MTVKLSGYGFSKAIQTVVQPIVESIDLQNLEEFSSQIAKLALHVASGIQAGRTSPQQADQYFTLIDLYLTDHCPDLKLASDLEDLIFEGTILHDYGKEYGANLETMRGLAAKILNPSGTDST